MASLTDTAVSTTKHSFEKRVKDVSCSKSDINALILDYLTLEGYPLAAAKFSKEANLQPQQEEEAIRARQEIQRHIHAGNFEGAIESLNELDPTILDDDEPLHFSLLRLQLVELIRNCNVPGGDVGYALKFAQEQLGPRAPVNPQFLQDLEKTMALLLIPQESLETPLAALLDPALRRDAADRVNKAIIEKHTTRTIAGIRNLVKMRCWAETNARAANVNFPNPLDIGLHHEDLGAQVRHDLDTELGNGHDDMVTS